MDEKWAILELTSWSELDYRLWSDTQYRWIPIKLLPNIDSNDACYNQLEMQDKYGKNMCTLYAPITMYSNNRKIPVTLKMRTILSDLRYKSSDFDRDTWWYLQTWVKIVVDTLKDGIMYRVHKSDIKTLLDKWYVVNIWIYTWVDVSTASSDWKITWPEIDNIKNAKYGHSTCLRKNVRINSYEWIKPNNKIVIEDIDKYLKSWIVYDWAYLIVPNYVLRDFYNWLLKTKNHTQAEEYFRLIDSQLYPREKLIFQWCMQNKYIWKINTPELKEIVF